MRGFFRADSVTYWLPAEASDLFVAFAPQWRFCPTQLMTGLACDHRFCTECWNFYLTNKIMEEGMGQVSSQVSFEIYEVAWNNLVS